MGLPPDAVAAIGCPPRAPGCPRTAAARSGQAQRRGQKRPRRRKAPRLPGAPPDRSLACELTGEAAEQQALALVLDAAGLRWCHVPSGGARGMRQAAELRAIGASSGVPDVLVFDPAGDYCGAALELKAPALRPKTTRAGRWSGARPEQREWLESLEARGWFCAVAYGAAHAVELLRAEGWRV